MSESIGGGRRIQVGELKAVADTLVHGEKILLSGVVYTARDAAHKKIFASLERGEVLPFPIEGAAIYYCGPTPAEPGRVVGSCGPTTSSRMDIYAPRLYDMGLAATIGKGPRNGAVCAAIKRNGALYLAAVGGAGALLADCVKSVVVIAYSELGCESVKRLMIVDLPLFVIKE